MKDDNKLTAKAEGEYEEDFIYLGRLIRDMWQGLARFWAMGAVFLAAGCTAGFLYIQFTYQPVYDAFATFTLSDSVSDTQTSGDVNLATQMGKTFTYIINSGVLREVAAKELGMSSITSEITAVPVAGTNMLTIHVKDKSPQMACDVLNSIINNYPEVAGYILGSTRLTAIDMSGVPDSPSVPKQVKKFTALGGLAGVVLFGAFLFLYALTRKSVRSAEDITGSIAVPLLTTLPRIPVKKRSKGSMSGLLVSRRNISPVFAEGFRLLANRIERLQKDMGQPCGVYFVASTVSGEGRTTVAVNLSLLLAQRGFRVLLIDADMRGPAIAQMLNITKTACNLKTVLEGGNRPEEAIQKNKKVPLYFLPGASAGSGPGETVPLSGGGMKELLDTCRRNYDYIIMDTPPLSLYADTAVLAALADYAVFVVKQDYAQLSDVLYEMGQLKDTGVGMAGFVLNGSAAKESSYGYGYSYSYTYGRGYGYSGEKEKSNLPQSHAGRQKKEH